MKTFDALKNIFQTIVRTSILTGALFFCTPCIHAAISDSTMHNDTITYSKADSLKARKMARLKHDTLNHFILDTIQENTTQQQDTIYTPSEKELKKKFEDHSPHRATILSAVVPGLGQAYNRKYWKIPIIYGAGLALYYGFDWLGFDEWGFRHFHEQYLHWKKLYYQEYYKPDGIKSDEDYYKKGMNFYDKKQEMIIIFMGILYVANIVDAMADAHFYYFDISDDLTMKILPDLATPDPYIAYNDYSIGVKLRFNF